MPSYKLTYFPGRGRAEPIRMCFAAADVKFEDVRIAGEEWAAFKPSKFQSLSFEEQVRPDRYSRKYVHCLYSGQ